jgi:hypothetical protein
MAALPEQIAEFGFGGGLSQKEDAWLSSSGMGTLHNCVQDKTGALQKHPGYDAFGTTFRNGDGVASFLASLMDLQSNSIGSAPKLIKRGDQVAAVAGGLLLAKVDKLTLQGRVSPWVCEQRTVCQVDDGIRLDCCCAGDWSYTAFEVAGGSVRVVVTYVPTNETVTVFSGNNFPATGLSDPRIVAIDGTGTAVLFYMNGTQGKYHKVTPDGVSTPSNITLHAGFDVVSSYNVVTNTTTNRVWVAYFAPSLITCDFYNYSAGNLSIGGTTSLATSVNTTAISLDVNVSANRMALCWVEYVGVGPNFTQTVRAMSRTTDLSASIWSARTIWQDVAEPIDPSHAIQGLGVALSPFDGHFIAFTDRTGDFVRGHWVSNAGSVEGTLGVNGDIIAPSVYLRSRPAWDTAGQRMFLLADASLNTGLVRRRGHFVLGIEPRSTLGKSLGFTVRLGILGFFSYLTAGSVTTGAADAKRITRPFLDRNARWHLQSIEIGGSGGSLQLLCDYAFSADDRVGVFAELGKATYITGALLSQWDGARVCEATFCLDPVIADAIGFGVVGGFLAAGNYTYAVTYARLTATGEIVRSRPSLTTIGAIGGGANAMIVEAFHPGPTNLTDRDDGRCIFVEFWRSEVNTTSPLHFAGRVYVDLYSSAAIQFNDLTASYATKEQLYSDGTNGEIANTAAASPLSICQWRNRLWMTDGEQIFYSKETAPARSAEWSQAFFVMARGAPERLTAVAPLGEVLMAFAEDSSSYVYGDGPSANGDGSTLVGPMPAVTELGCIQAAGIAQLPDGLLVRTRRGLHLLNGQRSFSYVGAAIEDTMKKFPRVRCMRHISGTDRVWICLAATDLTDGTVVLLDAHHKTFSTLFSQVNFLDPGKVPCSSIDLNGAHTFSVQDGHLYDQNPAKFQLDNLDYRQAVETPWFNSNGPSAELRARRFFLLMKDMGTSARSSLRVEIGYDFEDTYHYAIDLDTSFLVLAEGEPDTLTLRMPFPRQRCRSYRLRFTELNSFGAGNEPGFRFVSLRMVTSLRPGTGKLLSKNNAPLAFVKS